MSGGITKNFAWSEFASKHNGVETPVPNEFRQNAVALANVGEEIRAEVCAQTMHDTPIDVLCAYRTQEQNSDPAYPGRAEFSQHLVCKAFDIKVEGMTPSELLSCVKLTRAYRNGVIGWTELNDTFVHVDIGPKASAQTRADSVRALLGVS